jgi:hypothetical protein
MIHYLSSIKVMTSTENRAEMEAERMHTPKEVDANTTGNITVDR